MRRVIVENNKALMVSSKLLGTQDWQLPPEYVELQYVTMNSQYIDTGEKTNQSTVIEARVKPTTTTSTYLWLSDSSSSGTKNTTAYFSSSGYWRFGSRYVSVANASYYGTFRDYKQSVEGVWIDGVRRGTYSTVSSFTSNNNLRFGSSAATDNQWVSFKHTKGGELVSYYKACKRASDNVAGFYDLIKEEFIEGGTAGPAIS